MLSNSRLFLCFICLVATMIVGWLLFVLPTYCSAGKLSLEAARFHQQAIRYTDLANEISLQNVVLKNVVQSQQAQISDLPTVPDIPGLMKELTPSVDKEIVGDQLFTLGQSREAVIDSDLGLSYVPITIEMVSSFSAVFALIHAAESQGRPLRVASVHMTRFAESNSEDHDSRIRASIVLELLYNPQAGEEGS